MTPKKKTQGEGLLLTFLFFFSFFSFPVSAQEIPVNLKADNLKYIEGSRFVEATGSVEVEIKGIKIFADHRYFNLLFGIFKFIHKQVPLAALF